MIYPDRATQDSRVLKMKKYDNAKNNLKLLSYTEVSVHSLNELLSFDQYN